MAAMGNSSVQPKNSQGFMMLLSYALCEWFLIFMLFIDAGLSYLLTKFARYCDLRPPCPLCSRIDHVLEKRNSGYYRDLLCGDHREKISCLVKCNNHEKLVDVHAMCEDCIASFIKSIKSSSQMTCSCCCKILRATPKVERFFQVTPVGFGASKATKVKPPLPRVPNRSRFSRRSSLKRLRDKIAGPNSPRSVVNSGVDKLSHVGYTELKITSESESEVPMSDDGYSTSASCRKGNHKVSYGRRKGSQKLPNEINESLNQSVFSESTEPRNSANSLGEHDWDNPIANASTSSALPELMDDVLKDSAITVESNVLIKQRPKLSILPELDQLNHGLPIFSAKENSEILVDCTGNINSRNVLLSKTSQNGVSENENHSQSNHGNSFDKLISTCREPSSTETTRGIHVDQEELQRSGSSSSDTIEMIQMSPELDSFSVKEIDGESVVERLKRQIDYDRRCMKALFKELEEERNAASVAANQTMAMITRLQEEKASLHMESLQYLRMMEEQAEYDMEALEKANELLAEREKEIKDLEHELEIYRCNYLDDEPTTDGSRLEEQTNHIEIGPGLSGELSSVDKEYLLDQTVI